MCSTLSDKENEKKHDLPKACFPLTYKVEINLSFDTNFTNTSRICSFLVGCFKMFF